MAEPTSGPTDNEYLAAAKVMLGVFAVLYVIASFAHPQLVGMADKAESSSK